MSTALVNVLGFAAFGLAARFGQLGIQKRPLMTNPLGHIISMGAFGFMGYWAHVWDLRATEIIEQQQAQIAEKRRLKEERMVAVRAAQGS